MSSAGGFVDRNSILSFTLLSVAITRTSSATAASVVLRFSKAGLSSSMIMVFNMANWFRAWKPPWAQAG